MTNKLWEASLKEKKNSNLYAFEKFIVDSATCTAVPACG